MVCGVSPRRNLWLQRGPPRLQEQGFRLPTVDATHEALAPVWTLQRSLSGQAAWNTSLAR